MTRQFVCNNCNCVDLVDLAFAGPFPHNPADQLCTFCKTGTWHNQFPREPYLPEEDTVVNRPDGLGLG